MSIRRDLGLHLNLATPLALFGEDEKDAGDLADLLRMGRLPEAWIAPAEIRELRELTRYRMLCRHRHSIRYAEARIMPMPGRVAWVPMVAGWNPRHNPGAVS